MKNVLIAGIMLAVTAALADRVKVDGGTLQSGAGTDPAIRVFRAIPFAVPPVGALRWAPPQKVAPCVKLA